MSKNNYSDQFSSYINDINTRMINEQLSFPFHILIFQAQLAKLETNHSFVFDFELTSYITHCQEDRTIKFHFDQGLYK